ncbi:MAG: alpha-galactosidase [Cyclobacteriaceae bacterium]|nr:alpha-galactosidase [Cyclobacteriaceae bacterium]
MRNFISLCWQGELSQYQYFISSHTDINMESKNNRRLNKLLTIGVGIFLLHSLSPEISAGQAVSNFDLSGNQIQIVGDFQDFSVDVTIDKIADGLELATLKLTHQQGATPPPFSLKWQLPSSNIAGYWSSASFTNKTIKPDWNPSKVRSMLAKEAPVVTLFGHDDLNRVTFSVSEALNTVVSSTSVREEDGMIYNEIKFFSEAHKELQTYEVKVRLDTRDLPYAVSIQEVAAWWASFEHYQPLTVPEVARLPVYSTWYSYHQNVSADAILSECKVAKEMGFESIIVDDGWQTLDASRGYAFTGDWEPERIPEMKELVQKVHDLGMKFVLWYAVPFVGEKSKAYDRMKGKFLRYWDGQGTYVLDPRFPEVRDFIIQVYVRAVKEWDLDGFKLDFIGRFTADDETVLKATEGRDYASVNEATDVLMTSLVQELKKIKPDIMIEFRQPYSGPAMRKYGNMFRAADCPNLALINRVRTTDLRLLSGSTAVHSDMLMWHYDEPVETAALQLLNVLFSVPQISVRLEDIPQDHFDMIKFYVDYWVTNRNVLLDGEFQAVNPLANYPLISGWSGDKKISTVYDNLAIPTETNGPPKFDVINANASNQILLAVKGPEKQYLYIIKSCLGIEIEKNTVSLKQGAYIFEVPPSGLISFAEVE